MYTGSSQLHAECVQCVGRPQECCVCTMCGASRYLLLHTSAVQCTTATRVQHLGISTSNQAAAELTYALRVLRHLASQLPLHWQHSSSSSRGMSVSSSKSTAAQHKRHNQLTTMATTHAAAVLHGAVRLEPTSATLPVHTHCHVPHRINPGHACRQKPHQQEHMPACCTCTSHLPTTASM
jgi:hypothetical protein